MIATNEREERAFDALIVSQLRAARHDEIDLEHLPELTDKEREALDSLGPDFVARLLAGEINRDRLDQAEQIQQIKQPSLWLERLMVLALALAAGALGLALYFGGLL